MRIPPESPHQGQKPSSSWLLRTQAQWIRLVAGSMVVLSLCLAWLFHPYWLFLTAFVGVNLLQSAFSNWCPLISFLRWLNVPET
jgi:hypothetical protein